MQIEILKNALKNVTANTIAHVTMITCQASKVNKAKAKDLGIDPNSVMKYSEIQIQLGSSYETRVNNQLGRENKVNDFIPESAYYRMVSGSLAVNKKDESKFYCIGFPMPNSKGESYYMINGKGVSKEYAESLFNASALKNYGTRQGTEKEIKILAPALNSIIRLALNGKVIL